ncbi:MAG: hypothetical protein LBB81_07335 [Treponema sp.]|jgi:hypothetical protein|nr:hypothetical protein [Treponema sp.]
MELNLNSRCYKYYKQMMKPHPKLEGVNWVVINGENITIVVFEEKAGKVKVREDVQSPFTGGVRHNHDNIEQICAFLGFSEDTPDEVKKAGYQTLRCINDETGIAGTGVLMWIAPGVYHDIPVPPSMFEEFQKTTPFPKGYPDGTIVYWADIFSPTRPDYYEYWKSL